MRPWMVWAYGGLVVAAVVFAGCEFSGDASATKDRGHEQSLAFPEATSPAGESAGPHQRGGRRWHHVRVTRESGTLN
jgi:hypothetical protein